MGDISSSQKGKKKPGRSGAVNAREADAISRELFDQGPVILFVWRAEAGWPVDYVSSNIDRFGYRAADLIEGRIRFAEMVHADDLTRVAEEVRQHSDNRRECFSQEYRILTAGGETLWVSDFTRIRYDDRGTITHYYGYLQDITAQKRSADQLRESQTQYETIVESFDGLVYICSSDYRIEFANKRLIERTGRNPAGEICYKALYDRDSICPWCVNEAMQPGKSARWEIQSPKDNRWYYVVNSPIRKADGSISKMVMIQDITDRKQSEEVLRRRDAILEAVGFASERFLTSPSWNQSVQEFLERLGLATQVSRCSIFEDEAPSTGAARADLIYEWTSAQTPRQLYNPVFQRFDYVARGFSRWLQTLNRGQIVSGHVRDFPESERQLLVSLGVQSMLIVPIFSGAERWGFIGFDETAREREWSAMEIDTLKIAAGILGAAIQQTKNRDELTKLTGAINQTADSVIITDRKGIILYVNPAFESITGYTRAEALGKTPRLLKSDRHPVGFFSHLWKTVLEGRVFRAEFVNRRKNGELYHQAETITPIKDAQGRVTHFVSTGRDVSARKQAEEEVRKSREMLQLVIDSIPQYIFWKDTNSVFIGCNRNFARSAGVGDPANIAGKTDYDLAWSREEADSYRAWDRQVVLEDNPAYHILETQRQTDGRMAWLDTNKIPLHDASGNVVGILGAYEDITERIKSEENVKRLAAFPQKNPNPVLEFNEDGTLSYLNKAALDWADTLGHQDIRSLLPPNLESILKESLDTNRTIRAVEVKIDNRTLSWSFIPIAEGRKVHVYGGDITDRLNMEQQLRQLQKMDAVGRLAGGVAHDFNNILTAIMGYTSVLNMEEGLSSDIRDQIQEIIRAAERAAGLTRQLLTFSRRQILQPRSLRVNDILNGMTSMMNRILGEHIRISIHYQPDLPVIRGDEVMIEQVILNLAINARDAMPHGGDLTISTQTASIGFEDCRRNPEARPGRYVCLSVADTGCGMDDATRASIFEPFFTTKEDGRGVGLGLATVYGIVKQHEGWIEARSAVNHGTLFRVYLPATNEPIHPPEGVPVPAPLDVRGGSETILVVEDEEAVRRLIVNTLDRYGYRALEASSGATALELWEKEADRIDLLLTDMVMPGGITGKDLAEMLIAKRPELRVLYTSGYNLDALGGTFVLDGKQKFLPKPFAPDVLARTVRDCLDQA